MHAILTCMQSLPQGVRRRRQRSVRFEGTSHCSSRTLARTWLPQGPVRGKEPSAASSRSEMQHEMKRPEGPVGRPPPCHEAEALATTSRPMTDGRVASIHHTRLTLCAIKQMIATPGSPYAAPRIYTLRHADTGNDRERRHSQRPNSAFTRVPNLLALPQWSGDLLS